MSTLASRIKERLKLTLREIRADCVEEFGEPIHLSACIVNGSIMITTYNEERLLIDYYEPLKDKPEDCDEI